MKNKFFYNKFLPILSVFLLILFIFNSSVFASFDFNYDNNTISFPDLPFNVSEHPYYVITYNKTIGGYQVGYPASSSDGKFFLSKDSSSGTYGPSYYITDTTNLGQWNYYNLVNGSWSSKNTTSRYHMSLSSNEHPNEGTLYYSTTDIYEDSTFSSIFFHQAPQGITKTLVEETEKVQIAEQLKIMIVGFLKYLIVLVISLIAFWKGWQFLSTQLRKA